MRCTLWCFYVRWMWYHTLNCSLTLTICPSCVDFNWQFRFRAILFYFYRWWLFLVLVHRLLKLLRMWGKSQGPFLINAVVKFIPASPHTASVPEPLIMQELLIIWELVSWCILNSKVSNTMITLNTYQFSYVLMPILKFKYWTDPAVWTLIGNSDSGLGWRKIYVCCLAHHLFMLSFWPNDFGRRMTDFHPSFMDFLWKKYQFFILFPFFTCCIQSEMSFISYC